MNMAQGETSDFYATWDYDGTPVDYSETSERLIGGPKFLTSPKYNKQQGCIRWRISGQRPLKVEVYKNGLQIHSFNYTEKGSVLHLNNSSRRRCGQYEIQVSNPFGTAIQRLEIRREHLN